METPNSPSPSSVLREVGSFIRSLDEQQEPWEGHSEQGGDQQPIQPEKASSPGPSKRSGKEVFVASLFQVSFLSDE